jgi:hypothetical protein
MGLFKELLDELDELEDIEARILNGQYEDPNEGGPASGRTISDVQGDIINAVNVNVLLYDSAHDLLASLERCADFMYRAALCGRETSKVSQAFIDACNHARTVIKKAKGEA